MVFLKTYWTLLLLVVLSIFSFLPFLQPGFFNFHDNTQVERVFEMGNALKDGMFPVRWVKNLGYGYGYPIFNYYSPLPYYIGGVLNITGINALLATKITFIIGILFSGVFMYYLVKEFYGKTAGLAASILYVYFPYHAVDIYVRGDIDEVYAYAILPIVILSVIKLYYSVRLSPDFLSNATWIILLGISLAAVAISHNLTAFMLFILLIILIPIIFKYTENKSKLSLYYFLGFLLGFSLSAFYTLPVIFEMQHTNVMSQIGGGANFGDHFVCAPQLWDSLWGFGGSTKGCLDGMSFKLGKLNILLVLLSMVLLILSLRLKIIISNKLLLMSSFALLFVSILFMTGVSHFLWNLIPNMAFVQYPWRFLNFAGLFLSIIAGFTVYTLSNLYNKKVSVGLSVFLILITLVFNVKLFNPKEIQPYENNYYTDTAHIQWETSKISDEYMWKGFKKPREAFEVKNKPLELILGKGMLTDVFETTNQISATANIQESSILKAGIAYFPAWKLYVNGKDHKYQIKNDGLYFHLLEGKQDIQFKFVQTPIEKLGNTLTIVGILTIILGIIWHRFGFIPKSSV